jgi:hypothetical protein
LTTQSSPSRTAGGAQRGQVGPGRRLAEQLAPDVVGAQQAGEVAPALVVAAVRDDRRPAHAQADVVDQGRDAGAGQLLGDDRLLHERAALPAVLARPRHAHQARLGEDPLRAAQTSLLLPGADRPLSRHHVQQLGGAFVEDGPDRRPVRRLVSGVVEVHAGLWHRSPVTVNGDCSAVRLPSTPLRCRP